MENTQKVIEPSAKFDRYLCSNLKSLNGNDTCNELIEFQKLRISALRNAAEISPLIKEVTIGPNSPVKMKEKEKSITSLVSEEDLTEDKIGVELKHTLMAKKYESKLRANYETIYKNLIENMIHKRTEIMEKYWKKRKESCERKAFELKSRKLQILKELQESDNLSVLEKAKLDEQNDQYVNKKTIENMNRILEEQNIATARFASITDSHTKICINYNEINQILQSDELPVHLCAKYVTALNSVILKINALMDACKNGLLTENEVKEAEVLASTIDNIKRKLTDEFALLKEEKCKKKEEEESKHKREVEIKLAKENAEMTKQKSLNSENMIMMGKPAKPKPLFYSHKNYLHYEELSKFLFLYENQYKDLVADASLKKFRFDCQKAVNTPVNAISSVSGIHMKDKYVKLSKLLKGEHVQVLDAYVTASQHPQGLPYCTALLAKKIVRQGALLVSSNPEAAFPLAVITVALLPQFPDFAKLLEANFHKECPYLVPMFLPQVEGQSDQDFYKSRGYIYNEGVVEKQDKFLKRMSGIFRLQCAIWISKCPKFVNASNPHGLQYAWLWLSSFLNLRPEPDICATLLYDFFAVCGSECNKKYGKQFIKIVRLIHKDYLKILEKIDEGGPKTRLEVYLQNVLKTGDIPPPSGLLPPNTW